jgi:hypothetical protein
MLVMHHFYPAVPPCNLIGDLPGLVGTSVIDYNNFKICVQLSHDIERLFNGSGNIFLLIVTGKKNAD